MSYKSSYVFTLVFTLLSLGASAQNNNINISWSTYYGGINDDNITSVSSAKNGDICIIGSTQSSDNIATPGSFLDTIPTTSLSNAKGYIAYFDSTGKRKWGTYCNAIPTDVTIDAYNNIYVLAQTTDTGLATPNSYQDTVRGGYEILLMKFDSSGNRVWSTYYGGNNNEYSGSIALTSNNEIVFAGITRSTANIASANAHQSIYGGFNDDCFLAMFDSSGNRIWSTYYGGSSNEGYDVNRLNLPNVAVDIYGNIVLSGTTISSNNIATPNAYKSILTSQNAPTSPFITWRTADVFIAKFDKNGVRQWGSYFGGVKHEIASGITCDNNGNIYISGYTDSKNDIASASAYQLSTNLIATFIAKFDGTGNRIWSTYYGDSIDQYRYLQHSKLAYDGFKHLYFTSYGMHNISTAGSIKPNRDSLDCALTKFDLNGNKVWATYFGGPIAEQSLNIVANGSTLLMCGASSSKTGISTTGAHQDTFGGVDLLTPIVWGGDGFLVKYDVSDTQVSIAQNFTDSVICPSTNTLSVPYIVSKDFNSNNIFSVQLSDATGSFSNAITIGSSNTATSGGISCTLPSAITAGTDYKIRIIATSPIDTSNERKVNIHTLALPTIHLSASPKDTICFRDSVTFYANIANPGINNQYAWYINGSLLSGITGSTFKTINIQNKDIVSCAITSNLSCLTVPYGIADSIKFTVHPTDTPKASITASPSSFVPYGSDIIFTASTAGLGLNPIFQWQKNGVDLPNRNTDTLQASYGPWQSGDTITFKIISVNPCVDPDTVISNSMVINYFGNVDDIANASLTIYPNPNNGSFRITGISAKDGVNIQVVNAVGQTVYEQQLYASNDKLNQQVSLPQNMPTGTYLLRVKNEDQIYTKTLTILK